MIFPKSRRDEIFIETAIKKTQNSEGVIYEIQRFDEYVAPSELWICYLPVFYKYDTPLGLKSLKLMRIGGN